MVIGIPVMDSHELTFTAVKHLAETTSQVRVVILDNCSKEPYIAEEFASLGIPVEVIRYTFNKGYYWPLIDLYNIYDDNFIGLIHNDVFTYEAGWDIRLVNDFAKDSQLGLVGFVGSNEIDDRGGRGGGTVLYFRGGMVQVGDQLIQAQDQSAGRRLTGLEAAACLDSVVMIFRRDAIPGIVRDDEKWEDLTPAHFYDRIWPLRCIENGWHVATFGTEINHLGGQTTVANPQYYQDCKDWLESRNIPYENPETEVYLVAERRYLTEYRDDKKLIPCRIGADYGYTKL